MQDIHPIGNSSGGGGGGSLFAGESTRPSRPHHHDLKCPRCHSFNTKFCYYNNYNLSQPRHFCKSCRRYWTKGGVLRNVPIGGSIRKTKLKPKPNPNPNIVITSSKTVAVEPKQLNSEHSMATLNQSPVEIGSMFQLMETEVKMPEMRSSDQTGDVKEDEGFFYLTGSVDESYWCESRWSDDDGNLNYLC